MPTITAFDGATLDVSDAAAREFSRLEAQLRMAKSEAAAILRDAVALRLGDAGVAGKSDEYLRAAFETMKASGARSSGPDMTERDAARAEYVRSLGDAWKH